MTYTIMNVVTGEAVTILNSKAEVQNWFSRLARLKDLNVTGKDMKSACTGMPYIKFYVCDWSLYHTLRRYQVIDEEGRSVDPRIWELEVPGRIYEQDTLDIKRAYSRRYRSRSKAKSFIRQMKREAAAGMELDIRPARTNTKLRMGKYNIPKLIRSEEWKCWKNKKAARQWGKHKKGACQPAKLAGMFLPAEEEDFFVSELP